MSWWVIRQPGEFKEAFGQSRKRKKFEAIEQWGRSRDGAEAVHTYKSTGCT